MKTLSIIYAFIFVLFSTVSFAQTNTKKETIKVWGNCGMCKKTIESAAKSAGAASATWDEESKILQVSYSPRKTSSDKIQQSIAASGYDTEKFNADNNAYDNLHGCCKYDRKEVSPDSAIKAACCEKGDCRDHCCKDGKCKNGAECSKESGCCKDNSNCKDKDCCKS